jgi:hypothetical protein
MGDVKALPFCTVINIRPYHHPDLPPGNPPLLSRTHTLTPVLLLSGKI